MKQRVAEMEMEANKLRELQAAAEQANAGDDSGSAMETDDDKAGADGRSVYVGNVSDTVFFSASKSERQTLLGGLQCYSRRNTRTLPSMWYNQQSNHPL